jgi:hypothetical protein
LPVRVHVVVVLFFLFLFLFFTAVSPCSYTLELIFRLSRSTAWAMSGSFVSSLLRFGPRFALHGIFAWGK